VSNFTFAVVLGVCVLAAGGVYAGKVARDVRKLDAAAAELRETAAGASSLAKTAVGAATLEAQKTRQDEIRESLKTVEAFFGEVDARSADHWFPSLGIPWSIEPDPVDFKRHYSLAADQLGREAAAALEPRKLGEGGGQLRPYVWQTSPDLPAKADLRALQREFWIQDRIIRAFARTGGLVTKPLEGGEVQRGVRSQSTGAAFDMVRYTVHLRCRPVDLLEVVHSLDGPFEIKHEDGKREEIVLPAVVDNIIVRAMTLDAGVSNHLVAETADGVAGEPPAEVTVFATILDYANEARR
jgi:hypothetical protein